MKMNKVLIICAHPDDEVLGCGGFISKYRELGVEFKVVFIGEGSSCRFEDLRSKEAIDSIKDRNDSAINALGFMNVHNLEFHNLPCGRLDQVPIISINKIIEKAIDTFEPDTVLTHSSCDVNNDHRIVFKSTLMSTRPSSRWCVHRLLSYEVLSSSEWSYVSNFMPNYFEEISEKNVSDKWRAMSHYESEIREYPFPRSLEGIKALSIMRGLQAGFRYAEAYQVIRIFQK
jgi:LmbE family N-acetylglucosaminyl deacetylase